MPPPDVLPPAEVLPPPPNGPVAAGPPLQIDPPPAPPRPPRPDSEKSPGSEKPDDTKQVPVIEAAPPRPRFLSVDAPERAPRGARVSVHVQVTQQEPTGSPFAGLKPLDLPPEGAVLTITVSAHALVPMGDLEQDLHVPASGDSEPIRFGFTTARAGLHTVVVRAFRGGTFLGDVQVQLSVESGALVEEGRRRTVPLQDLEPEPEPGDVTLLVAPTADGRYGFHLRGTESSPVELSQRLAGNPSQVVDMIVDELRRLAEGKSPYRTAALQRNHLRSLGVNLWADAVPEAIRTLFWEHADQIRSLTVISDTDTVPWELLYPMDGSNDRGFLVEQFPVVRRVLGQGRARTLPIRSAGYVVPPHSPTNALAEIELIRQRLGSRVTESSVIEQLTDLLTMLDAPPGLLHFACHNDFTDDAGSVVLMGDGPLRPVDLAPAVQSRIMAETGPLVFFNACRTAGQIPGLLKMMGWAQQFMAAGAGAFLGSLWPVRSSAASEFADAFYDAFVTKRLPLGQATMEARHRIIADDGDPTWLAYTVYGNPAATLAD
jgi:hypothetical protein